MLFAFDSTHNIWVNLKNYEEHKNCALVNPPPFSKHFYICETCKCVFSTFTEMQHKNHKTRLIQNKRFSDTTEIFSDSDSEISSDAESETSEPEEEKEIIIEEEKTDPRFIAKLQKVTTEINSRLRDYQRMALDIIKMSIDNKQNSLIQQFCGTGKSYVILGTVCNFPQNRTLILFPSIDLLTYFYKEYVENMKLPFNCVKIYSLEKFNITDLNQNNLIVLCTYQSVGKIKKLISKLFSLIILDESHNVYSKCRKFLLKKMPTTLHFTATPHKDHNFEEVPLVYNLNASYSIQNNYIQDYDLYFAPLVCKDMDMEIIIKLICDIMIKQNKKKVIIFNKYIENNENGSSISNYSKMQNLFEKFLNTNKVSVVGISSKNNLKEKNALFERFNTSEISILCNVSILREGINLPCADMAVFLEPKYSKKLIIQNIGRVLRLKSNKINSIILCPMFLNNTKVDASKLTKKQCSNIINVIDALKYFDTRIDEFTKTKKGKSPILYKVDNAHNYDKIFNKILEFIMDDDINWDENLQLTIDYIEDYGELPRMGGKIIDETEKELGLWLKRQKKNYKNKTGVFMNSEFIIKWEEFIKNKKKLQSL